VVKFVLVILTIISIALTANAQSMHASYWNLGSYCLDFRVSPPKIVDNEYGANKRWYVSEYGEIVLFYDSETKLLLNKNNTPVENVGSVEPGYFINLPNDPNIVCYFCSDIYYFIDLEKNKLVFQESVPGGFALNASVYNSTCDGIWLMALKEGGVESKLLTKDGIVQSVFSNFDFSLGGGGWVGGIKMSSDCSRFVFSNPDSKDLFYGVFDNSNGSLKEMSHHFFNNYDMVLESIISFDGTKIFLLLLNFRSSLDVVCVDIVDGEPCYEKMNVLGGFSVGGIIPRCYMSYGIDGNIYIHFITRRLISTIEKQSDGEYVYNDAFYMSNAPLGPTYFLPVYSWFSNSCGPTDSKSHTACLNSSTDYFIDNPVDGSKYVWNISPSGMGEVVSNSESYDKISVRWKNVGDAEISVYEVNSSGCNSDASSIEVKVLESPDAQFDNASLCYGEPLNVILRGVAPFALDYTLDGESFSIPDISTDIYKMPDTPGKYSILKVSDKNCTSAPEKNNNAVIGKEMKPLKIKIRE